MKLTFYGAAETVTGSCHLLQCADTQILIDCGMFQGSSELSELNREPFGFSVKDLRYMILTHAHMDHSGRIPKLVKDGYKGKIFTTQAAIDLCDVMLQDSAHIQEIEAEYDSRKNKRKGLDPVEPLYTTKDAQDSMKFFSAVEYGKMVRINDNVKFRLNDAGHMLGSSIVEIWVNEDGKEEKIVFSGDLGNTNKPLLNDPAPVTDADYLVMESTYGGRQHTLKSADESSEKFLKIIKETAEKGGNLVIPSFAVGRAQELLYELNYFKENHLLGEFSDIKVILDSPLAIKTTEIFKKYYNMLDAETRNTIKSGDDPLVFDNLVYSLTADDSKAINFDTEPNIIISASGMCDAGRIRHHIKHNIFKENCTLLFVGYQAEGTLGKILLDGATDIKLFGERIAVRAKIETLDHYSGHADHDGLLRWVNGFENKPKKIMLVHGEPEGLIALKAGLEGIGLNASVAKYKSTMDFAANEYIEAEKSPLPSRKATVGKLSVLAEEVFRKLQNEEALLKIDEANKIKLLLELIKDALAD